MKKTYCNNVFFVAEKYLFNSLKCYFLSVFWDKCFCLIKFKAPTRLSNDMYYIVTFTQQIKASPASDVSSVIVSVKTQEVIRRLNRISSMMSYYALKPVGDYICDQAFPSVYEISPKQTITSLASQPL